MMAVIKPDNKMYAGIMCQGINAKTSVNFKQKAVTGCGSKPGSSKFWPFYSSAKTYSHVC